jgi:hypothetical protein
MPACSFHSANICHLGHLAQHLFCTEFAVMINVMGTNMHGQLGCLPISVPGRYPPPYSLLRSHSPSLPALLLLLYPLC